MKKSNPKKTLWGRLILYCLLSLSCFFPLLVAHANSLPPPSVVWLEFDYTASETHKLLGVQLLGCATSACEQPVLLQQYGTCNQSGCAAAPGVLTGDEGDFDCAGGICRSTTPWGYDWSSFRVVAQFSDRVRVSDVVGGLPSEYGEESTWRVLVNETDLSLRLESAPPNIRDPYQAVYKNLGWAGISIAVELLVAGLFFQHFARADLRQLSKRLLMVLLVNLVSLPAVWLFIPSLGRFQSENSRNFGFSSLIMAGVFATLLACIYRTEGKTRRWMVILTAVILSLTAFCYLVVLPWLPIWYSSAVHVQGLSTNAVIITAELFSVGFEAIMITILSRRTLSLSLI